MLFLFGELAEQFWVYSLYKTCKSTKKGLSIFCLIEETRLMLSSKIYTFTTSLFSQISKNKCCDVYLQPTYLGNFYLHIQCNVYLAHLFLPDYDKTKELGLSHFFGLMITTPKKRLSLLWPKVLCHGTLVDDNHIMNKFLGSAAVCESNNQHLLKPSK